MIINSMIREHNYCGIVASTHEHVYNAWMRGDTMHLYILSNDNITDVIYYLKASIETGEIHLMVDDVAMTLYSHDELINAVRCAFPDDWHDVVTILETMLFIV